MILHIYLTFLIRPLILFLQKNGHQEEILSLAQSPSHMLASASYDGEIIVWKMMSGHIFCHLQAPVPYGYKDYSSMEIFLLYKYLIFQ